MSAHNLKQLGFDLAYLSLLTKSGLKPLSRWEGANAGSSPPKSGLVLPPKKGLSQKLRRILAAASPETEDILHGLGLKTRWVERSVLSGDRIRELLFSKSDECIDLYFSRFNGTAIDRSPTTMRIEGLLFGYPSCCVESFTQNGYVRNSLRRQDQRILFHWACPKCVVTPVLLPYYREIYRECRKAMQGRLLTAISTVREAVIHENLKRAIATAASLIALGALPPSHAKYSDDPHRIPLELWQDADQDFLTGDEEAFLDENPSIPDEDANGIPDGVDLAQALSSMIDSLPTEPTPLRPHIIHGYVFGVEACEACGEMINMGAMQVINPLENLSITIPYIGKHYMERGSFSYAGSIHAGRVNVAVLNTVLQSAGLAHFIPEPEGMDADNDGLHDWEEPVFQTEPQNRDTDGDHLIDGIDLARELRSQLDALPRGETKDQPYIIEHPMNGIEACPHCGEWVVMEIWDVINPTTGNSIQIPSMALHFMNHGGFAWKGGQLIGGEGRVDPRQLRAVLTGEGDGHWLHVSPDRDGDYLADEEENDLGRDLDNPDENSNQVLDGVEFAQSTAGVISALPTNPGADYVYRLNFELKGLERCDICGMNVNMGHLTVVNPMAQLYVRVPYISLHYMEHGSFSFAGNVHQKGRLDVKLLIDSLYSPGPGHMLGVSYDTDSDGLRDHEEDYFGTDKAVPDTDTDGVPDGFSFAHDLWGAVNALPSFPDSESGPKDSPFAVHHPLRGLEWCETCGENVNMGYVEVINRRENIVLSIPYIAMHYMQRGSFSYKGDLHGGRVNPCLLDLTLRAAGTSHLVAVPGDTDGDGLLDAEELYFGTRPDVPDTNGDWIFDGVELSRKMVEQIKALPIGENPANRYVVHYEADCYSPCPVCHEDINCGHISITNPMSGLSMSIPYINLHFMGFGGFAASGTIPPVRVDPLRLEAILRPGIVIALGENKIILRWKSIIGKTYQVLTAPYPSGPWTPGPTLPGTGEEMSYTTDDQYYVLNGSGFLKIVVW